MIRFWFAPKNVIATNLCFPLQKPSVVWLGLWPGLTLLHLLWQLICLNSQLRTEPSWVLEPATRIVDSNEQEKASKTEWVLLLLFVFFCYFLHCWLQERSHFSVPLELVRVENMYRNFVQKYVSAPLDMGKGLADVVLSGAMMEQELWLRVILFYFSGLPPEIKGVNLISHEGKKPFLIIGNGYGVTTEFPLPSRDQEFRHNHTLHYIWGNKNQGPGTFSIPYRSAAGSGFTSDRSSW